MAKPQQRAGDLSPARLVIVAAAVVGAGAFMGYGFVKMREGREAKVIAPADETSPESAASDLVARARQARHTLDTAALVRLEDELATAIEANPTASEAHELRGEWVEVLASLSLESCVRASVTKDPAALEQAGFYAGQADAALEQHGSQLDPGVVLAARSRDALCEGKEDVLARHPAVLHPGFRDRELRYALLAEPLWRSVGPDAEPFDEGARANLVRALDQLSEPTTFERLTLALALPASDPRAESIVGEVLAAVPAQPLAKAVQARLRAGSQVAVADPLPTEPTEPEPTEAADPAPTKKPGPTPKQPEPTEPEPTEPEPTEAADPGPTKKPNPTPKQPKPKAPATDLAEEGCKLVRSGKAEQGFAMLQRAFDQDPRDTKVILCMAEGHMKLDRLPSARAMVERVLRSSGKNKKALQLAAKIEDQLGNERAAADYYRKLLELEPDNATAKAYVDKHGG